MGSDYYHDLGCQNICVTVSDETLARIKSAAKAEGKCLRAWCNNAVEALAQVQMSGRVPYVAPIVPGAGRKFQFWINRQNANLMALGTANAQISNRAWVYTALVLALHASQISNSGAIEPVEQRQKALERTGRKHPPAIARQACAEELPRL